VSREVNFGVNFDVNVSKIQFGLRCTKKSQHGYNVNTKNF